MELHYRAGDEVATVRLERAGDGRFRAVIGARTHEVLVRRAQGGALDLVVDGRTVRAFAATDGPRRLVRVQGEEPVALLRAESRRAAAGRARGAAGEEGLAANMHAQVVAILVKEGDLVERGAPLVVLEAMKMELRVAAPHAGRVKAIGCRAGDVVERGRVLIELEETS
jgi:3-methylcrotonyl-CoA carboxylase alpha subunit